MVNIIILIIEILEMINLLLINILIFINNNYN